MKINKKHRKHGVLRVIGITAAALTACGGAVCLFLKRRSLKKYYTAFTIAAVIFCSMMMCGMTAYAAPGQETDTITATEPDTDISEIEYDYDTEPDEIIIGDPVEIDITGPDRNPNQITPPGNLNLVDDLSGAQTDDKQFITVQTKNGNYFYIIIDRAGNKENVYFLNLVDEYDLLQILQGEDAQPPAPLPGTPNTTTEQPPEDEPGDPDAPEQPKSNNNTGLLIMLLVIAAGGGGAFYWFKIRKPKPGGTKNAVKSELDEFDFDPDEDDLFDGNGDAGEQDDSGDDFDDVPDFLAADDTGQDSGDDE